MPTDNFRLAKDLKLSPGAALLHHGHAELAIPFLEKEDGPVSKINLSMAYRWTDRLTSAWDLAKENAKQHPDIAQAWTVLGSLNEDYSRWMEAEGCHAVAYSLNSQNPQYALNLACALMRQGMLEKAWPYWEMGRFGVSWNPPHPSLEPWSGQPDSKVVCLSEGGYGDAFLFSRFLQPDMLFWVWDQIADLGLYPCPTAKHSDQLDLTGYTHSTSILSLPSFNLKSISDIPQYVPPSNQLWASGKWGICWGAEENGVRRRLRSLPSSSLNRLQDIKGPGWVSLYPNPPADNPRPSWVEQPDFSHGWEGTIELINSLSLVVSADTAVAHLACLLGKPTYILVPSHSDWKWFTEDLVGSGCPWWPTASIIRNTDPLSWEPAITELEKRLAQS